MKKSFILVAFATLALGFTAQAQTNFQTFYDFGRKHFTTTLEGFHTDAWGNTFFFIDYDYNNKDGNKVISPNNTYFEIARCLNFWQDSALAPLSLQVEYNGGFGTWGNLSGVPGVDYGAFPVNNAFLFGLDWFLHTKDFSSTLNFKLLYKHFTGMKSPVPLQFTTVWGCQDVFGLKGLRFSGFLDVWSETNAALGDHVVVLSEPQIWFQIFDHCNIGTEIEFSYNFAGMEGFNVMPCLGWKWVF